MKEKVKTLEQQLAVDEKQEAELKECKYRLEGKVLQLENTIEDHYVTIESFAQHLESLSEIQKLLCLHELAAFFNLINTIQDNSTSLFKLVDIFKPLAELLKDYVRTTKRDCSSDDSDSLPPPFDPPLYRNNRKRKGPPPIMDCLQNSHDIN